MNQTIKKYFNAWRKMEINQSTEDVQVDIRQLDPVEKMKVVVAYTVVLAASIGIYVGATNAIIGGSDVKKTLIDKLSYSPVQALFFDDYTSEKEELEVKNKKMSADIMDKQSLIVPIPSGTRYAVNDYLADIKNGTESDNILLNAIKTSKSYLQYQVLWLNKFIVSDETKIADFGDMTLAEAFNYKTKLVGDDLKNANNMIFKKLKSLTNLNDIVIQNVVKNGLSVKVKTGFYQRRVGEASAEEQLEALKNMDLPKDPSNEWKSLILNGKKQLIIKSSVKSYRLNLANIYSSPVLNREVVRLADAKKEAMEVRRAEALKNKAAIEKEIAEMQKSFNLQQAALSAINEFQSFFTQFEENTQPTASSSKLKAQMKELDEQVQISLDEIEG